MAANAESARARNGEHCYRVTLLCESPGFPDRHWTPIVSADTADAAAAIALELADLDGYRQSARPMRERWVEKRWTLESVTFMHDYQFHRAGGDPE